MARVRNARDQDFPVSVIFFEGLIVAGAVGMGRQLIAMRMGMVPAGERATVLPAGGGLRRGDMDDPWGGAVPLHRSRSLSWPAGDPGCDCGSRGCFLVRVVVTRAKLLLPVDKGMLRTGDG